MNRKCWMKKIVSALTATIMAVSIFSPGVIFPANGVVFAADADNPNLALGKSATASGHGANFTENLAFDGDWKTHTSRWSSADFSNGAQWITVDLGASKTIKEIDIYWENVSCDYNIQTSVDGSSWINAGDFTHDISDKNYIVDFPDKHVLSNEVNARYLRINATKGSPTWSYSVGIYEIEVYGAEKAADTNPNLAFNRPFAAYKSSGNENPTFTQEKAFDGNKTGQSRWSSSRNAYPQWISVDLGAPQTIKEIDIYWEAASYDYIIQTSNDGSSWANTEGVVIPNDATADFPMKHVLNDSVTARYLRINATKGSPNWADSVGIYEIEVYGAETNAEANLALNRPAVSSGNEADKFTPDKAFDGGTTGDSRWSSSASQGDFQADFSKNPQWIYVDLGRVKSINKILLYWEGAAGRKFEIQVSNNASVWKNVKTVNMNQTDAVPSPSEYTFESAIEGRYVRVYITEGTTNAWKCVSLYEMEVYGDESVVTIGDYFDTVKPAPSSDSQQLVLAPTAPPEGYSLEIFGSNAKEIVDLDGNLSKPLVDKTVKLIVRLVNDSDEGDFLEKEVQVKIPGAKSTSSGNAEPTVIPSLREWSGGSGSLTINSSSNIVIDADNEDELQAAAEYTQADFEDLFGFTPSITTGTPGNGDIYLSMDDADDALGEEGYYMNIDDYVTIQAPAVTGVFYGTRSVLQILKASGDRSIPKGEARDYPKYEYRGIQLDVARKFVPMDFLQDYLKLMSWYKMNFINVHLNDNGFPSYFGNNWENTYSAFRLESDTHPGLTSTDGSYTKDEFRQLQLDGKAVGVNVIPEIDTPGHSLHLVKYNPSLWSDVTNNGFAKDHLDLMGDKSLEFVKELFTEYMEGDNPVFIDKVNIGTDEYANDTQEINEAFRNYTNELLTLVKDHDKQPWLWGALSDNPGTTHVDPEDATMLVWSNGYAIPADMLALGWDIISINDGQTYIVPASGYYPDYQDSVARYNDWEANNVGGVIVSDAHPQIKGGALGVWNDIVGNGISVDDIHDRVMPLMTVFAEKLWQGKRSDVNIDQFTTKANLLGEAPRANISWRYEDVPDNVIMDVPFEDDFDSTASFDVELTAGDGVSIVEDPERGKVAQFDGSVESYIKTSVENVGFGQSTQFNGGTNSLPSNSNLANGEGWTLSVSIKPDAGNPDDAVLFESEKGQVKLKQTDTGKIGFSKEVFENFAHNDNYNHRFDYEVEEGVWTDIVMVGNNNGTSLYVNGELVERLEKSGVPFLTGTAGELTRNYVETLVFPTELIGSESNSFSGLMDDLKIYNKAFTATEIRSAAEADDALIPLDGMTFTDGDHQGSDDISKAFDGNPDTMWHTTYNGAARDKHWANIHFNEPTTVDGLRYLPRQTTSPNGIITSYEIQVSTDNGATYKPVAEGDWDWGNWNWHEFDGKNWDGWERRNNALKFVNFEPQEAVTDVKLISKKSLWQYAYVSKLEDQNETNNEKNRDKLIYDTDEFKFFTSAAEIRLTRPTSTGRPVFTDADGGTKLSALTAEKMNVTYVHENGSGAEQNLKMLVAVYSPEGKLVHTAATDAKTAAADASTTFSVTFEMTENAEGKYAEEGYSASVFLWGNATLVPVIDKFDFK